MTVGKKKAVVLRPFHEVAFEILEKGLNSEAYKQIAAWVSGYGQDAVLTVAFLLTRCVVPEKEQVRIVPALIAASKGAGQDYEEVNKAVAFALTHFMPGKSGLKALGKLLSAEYLKCEGGSEEADGLKDLLKTLELEVPERPAKKEEAKKPAPKKPPAKKATGKKAGKAQAKGGGKKKQKLTK